MSFSVEDVREQLKKRGLDNVPDAVIQKFVARLEAQRVAQEKAEAESVKDLPPAPVQPIHPANVKAFAPAQLPPAVPYVHPFSNQPVSSPLYSSLSQPIVANVAPSLVPALPLSLRTNPAFASQQTAVNPAAQFTPYVPFTAPLAVPQPAPAKKVTIVEQKGHSVKVEDETADEEAHFRAREKEITVIEERLKRQAAVAHGVKSIISPAVAAAAAAAADKENSADGGNVRARVDATVGLNSKALGNSRTANQSVPSLTDGFKSLDKPANAAPKSILRPSSSAATFASASAVSAAATAATARPVSARPATARAAAPIEDAAAAAGSAASIDVVSLDTCRSLRKTYGASLAKYKGLNPRFGAGGFRKSDPVTRYQAFKNKWDNSSFLNRKTTITTTTGSTTPRQIPSSAAVGQKAVWRA